MIRKGSKNNHTPAELKSIYKGLKGKTYTAENVIGPVQKWDLTKLQDTVERRPGKAHRRLIEW